MINTLGYEVKVFVWCIVLGVICGVVFDLFKALRYGKAIKKWTLVIQDVLYFVIITIISFEMILYINGAMLRFYMPFAALAAFVFYRFIISEKIVWFLVKLKLLLVSIFKLICKITVFPIIRLLKLLAIPFLRIKHKVLRKKVKIALTFKRFCFKIKYNVGMLFIGKNVCKERKPCRRKQKPPKKV